MGRGDPVQFGTRVTLRLPGGASLAYRDSTVPSASHPLMLLHGLGMTADLNWGPAYAELCDSFRVVAPDLPGHGRGVHRGPTTASNNARITLWRWLIRWQSTDSSRAATRWEA